MKVNIDYIKSQLSFCVEKADKKAQYTSVHTLDDAISAAEHMESELIETAKNNGRLRAIETLHPMGKDNISTSKTNIMFNYIHRGSWIPPHKHDNKDTFYYILSGILAFLIFKNDEITSVVLQAGDYYMIEKDVFHSDLILADYCYVLSGKNSGFDPATDKTLLQGDWPKEYIDTDGKWTTDWQHVKKIHSNWKKIIYEQCCGLLPLDCQIRRTLNNIYSYSEIMANQSETNEPFSIYCSAGGNGVRFFGNNRATDSKCLQKVTVDGHNLSILEISLIYFNYLKKTCDNPLPLKNISTITPNAHNKIECSIQKFLDSNKLEISIIPFKSRLDPIPGSVHIIIDYIISGRLQCDVVSGAKVVVLHPMEALGMLIEQKIINFTANGDASLYFGIREQDIDRGGALTINRHGKVEVIYDEDIKDKLYYKNLFQIYINLDNFLNELAISKSDIADMRYDELISITNNRILKIMKETHQPFNGYAENKANNAYHIDATTRIFNTSFIQLDGIYWDRDCGLKYQYNLPDVEKYAAKYYTEPIKRFFKDKRDG